MSLKTIIILYKEKESKIELNLSEINNYNLLIKHILSFYNESDTVFTFHLMTINSSNPYTLLDEENFNQIMNEEIEGDSLKLFLNKINPEEINADTNNNDDYNIKNVDEKDDDFIIDEGEDDNIKINKEEIRKEEIKKEEKEKDNIININNNDEIDKQLKINENYNIINDDKNINSDNIDNIDNININEQELFNQSDEMMKKIDQLMGFNNNNNNLQILEDSKPSTKNEIIDERNLKNKENIININKKENENEMITPQMPFSHRNQNHNLNIININNEEEKDEINFDDMKNNKELNTNDGIFKSSRCIICNSQLSDIKYICCICENCVLCENCENTHFHPCFKLKTSFLSSINDLYKFISTFYSFKPITKNFFTKLFTKEYEIKLSPFSDDKICLRPNKNFIFAIKIQNLSKNSISSLKFEIISQNNKIIKILNQNIIYEIGPNSSYIYKFKCKTKRNKGKDLVHFQLFSDNLTFKNKNGLDFDIYFEINEDWDEEQMNINFENNEYAILYSKEHKQTALEILKSVGIPLSNKEKIKKAFEIFTKNNWDKNLTINKIKNLKN